MRRQLVFRVDKGLISCFKKTICCQDIGSPLLHLFVKKWWTLWKNFGVSCWFSILCLVKQSQCDAYSFKFLRIVMGVPSYPELARMVLLHLEKLIAQKYPLGYISFSSDKYFDDAGVFGDSEEKGTETANQVIQCLNPIHIKVFYNSFILTDNRKIMISIHKKCQHPSIIQALEITVPLVLGLIGNTVEF